MHDANACGNYKLRLYCDDSHLVSSECEIINVLRHSHLVIVDCLWNRHCKNYMNLKVKWKYLFHNKVFFFFWYCLTYMCEGVTRGQPRPIDLKSSFILSLSLSLNSLTAVKWCTKLNVVQKRCPLVFQGHSSNFKVTRDKKITVWPELRVCGLSLQFEFIDGFEMMHKDWHSIEEVPYCFSRSSIKFHGHTGWKINLNPTWVRLLGWS